MTYNGRGREQNDSEKPGEAEGKPQPRREKFWLSIKNSSDVKITSSGHSLTTKDPRFSWAYSSTRHSLPVALALRWVECRAGFILGKTVMP